MTREASFNSGNWRFERYSGNRYFAYYVATSDNTIAQTGSDVTIQLTVPFPHRLIGFDIHHMSSAYADSADQLNISIKRTLVASFPARAQVNLYTDSLFNADGTEKFGETFEYPPATYDITLNTTSTDKALLIFYFQLLED